MYLAIFLITLLKVILVSCDEGSCQEGLYGENCELQCSTNCRPLETFPCDKDTGRCSEGCKGGFYGATCNLNCSCAGSCIQETGDCIGDKPKGKQCREEEDKNANVWKITTFALCGIIVLLIGVFAVYVLCTRRQRRPRFSNSSGAGREETEIMLRELEKVESKGGGKGKESKEFIAAKNELIRLKEEHEKLKEDYNNTLKNLGLHQNSTYRLRKGQQVKKSIFLQCTRLHLDVDKVNLRKMNIDSYGKMSNQPDSSYKDKSDDGRFVKYSGTTTTTPLHVTGSPQYMEVHTNIAILQPVIENEVILELAFCNENDRDLYLFMTGRKPNCLKVIYSAEHQQFCIFVQDKLVHKLSDKENKEESIFSINFGIVLNEKLKKITFLHIGNNQIMGSLSIDLNKEAWPLFGLGAQGRARSNMSLLSGNDIELTDEKMEIIESTLNNTFGFT